MISQKVVAEFDPSDAVWLVMWPSGDIERFMTADALYREVRRRDARRVARQGSQCNVIVTTIEWRNVPAGFVVPREG